jgi:hypothetical protein
MEKVNFTTYKIKKLYTAKRVVKIVNVDLLHRYKTPIFSEQPEIEQQIQTDKLSITNKEVLETESEKVKADGKLRHNIDFEELDSENYRLFNTQEPPEETDYDIDDNEPQSKESNIEEWFSIDNNNEEPVLEKETKKRENDTKKEANNIMSEILDKVAGTDIVQIPQKMEIQEDDDVTPVDENFSEGITSKQDNIPIIEDPNNNVDKVSIMNNLPTISLEPIEVEYWEPTPLVNKVGYLKRKKFVQEKEPTKPKIKKDIDPRIPEKNTIQTRKRKHPPTE